MVKDSNGVDGYDVHESHQQKTGLGLKAFQDAESKKLVNWKNT